MILIIPVTSEWTPDVEFEEDPEEEMDTLELQKFIQKIFPSKAWKRTIEHNLRKFR